MRRWAAVLASAATALLAGCGGGGHQSTTPLDNALGYFPTDAPLVAAIQTDPHSAQVERAESYSAGVVGSILATRVESFARLRFVEWARDVQPQLGAPAVVGLEPTGDATAPLLAVVIKRPLQAKQVLLRQPNVRGSDKSEGVRIYEDRIDSRYFAVDDHVFLAAGSRAVLEHALAVKRGQSRMREADFEAAVEHLPAGALVRISADPKQLTGVRTGVKWLDATRRLGATIKLVKTGLALDFDIGTDAAKISDDDLPLSPKSGDVPLIGKRGEVQIGLRDPGRLARFAFALWRALAPQRAARFRALEPRGVDLQRQLPHHLRDNAALAFDPATRAFAARADLNEAADVRAALTALAPALPDLASSLGIRNLGVGAPQPGGSFWALADTHGRSAVFGVVGDELVAASSPARASGLASAPAHSAPHGVKGAAVVTVDAHRLVGELVAQRLRGAAALLGPLALGGLRDLTGALTISRDGLGGHFALTIVR